MIAARALPPIAALALALALLSCGNGQTTGRGERSTSPSSRASGSVANSPERVIRAWVDTLRHGRVAKAASYFALPAIVQNGTPPVKLTTIAEIRAFNTSLPCGARLVRTYRSGRYTTAVFRLTERPGAGRCGSGAGRSARTAFLIRDGKIREWRRVPDRPAITAPVV